MYGKGGHDTLNEGSTPADGSVSALCGGTGGDKLNGSTGPDWYFFAPGWGKDKILGEESDPPPSFPTHQTETLFFFPGLEGCGSVVAEPLTIDLAKGVAFETDAGPTGANTVSFNAPQIENVVGGSGDDTIKGNSSPNYIRGDDGNDTIDVRGGGNDSVFCGAGNDIVVAGGKDGTSGCESVYDYSYSAVDEFSATQNPSGVWSYGYRASGGSGFTHYTNHRLFPDCASLDQWYVDGGGVRGEPAVSYNHTGQTVSCLTIKHPPDVLNLHPGPLGEKSVVRWTAPLTGSATIYARFEGIDTVGTTTDVGVTHHMSSSSESLLSSNVNGYGATVPFSYIRPVVAGDTIDFVVGYGSNASYFNDSTGLSVTIYLYTYGQ